MGVGQTSTPRRTVPISRMCVITVEKVGIESQYVSPSTWGRPQQKLQELQPPVREIPLYHLHHQWIRESKLLPPQKLPWPVSVQHVMNSDAALKFCNYFRNKRVKIPFSHFMLFKRMLTYCKGSSHGRLGSNFIVH